MNAKKTKYDGIGGATHQVSTAECHILPISQANGADLRSIEKHKRNQTSTSRTKKEMI